MKNGDRTGSGAISNPSQLCAVLVTDICGSTRLYESVGDARAFRLVEGCISRLRDDISTYGGRVVKTMGDGILATFPSPDAAFSAAIEMQKIENDSDVHIRVAINYGSVVRKGRDVFGDSVNTAAHMLSMAKASEIVLTGEAVLNLSPKLRARTQFFDRANLKGKSSRTDFYRVLSGGRDTTLISREAPVQETQPHSLVLHFGNREILVGEGVREFSIGRSADCDLMVEGSFVSRRHATIKAQRGNYYLVDHSANGTHVMFGDGEPVFLKRDQTQLRNVGAISLGPVADPNSQTLIRFDCGSHTH